MSKALIYISILLGSVAFSSCQRDEIETWPRVCTPEGFEVTTELTLSSTNVDFTLGEQLDITAGFSHEVAWTLEITGTSSGGYYMINDTSSSVSFTWNGKAQEGHPFFKDETCNVSLTIQCHDPETKSLTITAPQGDIFGYLISNFDGNGGMPGTYSYGAGVSGTPGPSTTPIEASPEGGNYFKMIGDSPTAIWFFGGFGGGYTPAGLDSDPSNVYINMFLNANGSSNTLASITLVDGSNHLINVHVDWTGWQMVSIPLSDFGISDPSALTDIEIGLGGAVTTSTHEEIYVDYIILTNGGPYYN